METILGISLIISTYALIYYRLMVRHYYEQEHKVKETAFGTIFSFPPHGKLSPQGKKYSWRYWMALIFMLGIVAILVKIKNFTVIS